MCQDGGAVSKRCRGDQKIVRADRLSRCRELRRQPRIHAYHAEVEPKHRKSRENRLDEGLAPQAPVLRISPMDAGQKF